MGFIKTMGMTYNITLQPCSGQDNFYLVFVDADHFIYNRKAKTGSKTGEMKGLQKYIMFIIFAN